MHGHGSIIPPGLFFRNRTTFPVTGESPCFILDLLNDAGQKYRKHVYIFEKYVCNDITYKHYIW